MTEELPAQLDLAAKLRLVTGAGLWAKAETLQTGLRCGLIVGPSTMCVC